MFDKVFIVALSCMLKMKIKKEVREIMRLTKQV